MKLDLSKMMKQANALAHQFAQTRGGTQKQYLSESIKIIRNQDHSTNAGFSELVIKDAFQIIKRTGKLTNQDVSKLTGIVSKAYLNDLKHAILAVIGTSTQVNGSLEHLNTSLVSSVFDRFYSDLRDVA